MKGTVKLIAETHSGESVENEVAAIERADVASPVTVRLSISEGKAILESLQEQIVGAQIQHHGAHIPACPRCGKAFRTKGYYRSILRSVYGNVRIRVRCIKGCSCSGMQGRSFSTLFTNKNPTTPELKYLTAKMAALLPFGKVVDFLSELLPLSAKTTASTVRNRTMKVGKRLEKSAEALAQPPTSNPAQEVVVGLDGGYGALSSARFRRVQVPPVLE